MKKIMMLVVLVMVIGFASTTSAQQMVIGLPFISIRLPSIYIGPPVVITQVPPQEYYGREPIYGYVPPECYPYNQGSCRQYYNRPHYDDHNNSHQNNNHQNNNHQNQQHRK
jgi:hypothetical protein